MLESGENGSHWRGGQHAAGSERLIVISPHDVHVGYSTTPDGWSYRMLYPAVDLLREGLAAL